MRITSLIDFINSGTDPLAIEVRYHHICWQEHVSHPVTFAKCLPNRSKISLLQAGSKDFF